MLFLQIKCREKLQMNTLFILLAVKAQSKN
jgi:hypothetical protein